MLPPLLLCPRRIQKPVNPSHHPETDQRKHEKAAKQNHILHPNLSFPCLEPQPLDVEAFLNVLVCSQNQHGAVGRETGLRRNDRHGEVSVLLDGQYAHMMPFPDIQLADGLADPVIRNLNLKDGMIVPSAI